MDVPGPSFLQGDDDDENINQWRELLPPKNKEELAALYKDATPVSWPKVVSEQPPPQQSPHATSSTSAAPSSQPAVTEQLNWKKRSAKPSKDEFIHTSQELVDFVQLCNVAHTAGVGDFIWLSWNPRKERGPKHPSNGSYAIALTASGARALNEIFDDVIDPGHIDISLRYALEQNAILREKLPASYVFPPLGACLDHLSHNNGGQMREGVWHNEWGHTPAQGTRKSTQPSNFQASSRSAPLCMAKANLRRRSCTTI